MTNPSENVFTYYRGPSARQSGGAGIQLEDNTTANLLLILEQASQTDPQVARNIIAQLSGNVVSALPEGNDLDCSTQRHVDDIDPAEKTILTAIANNTPRPKRVEVDADSGGRCDGVIRLDDRLAIVLEIKFQDAELGDGQWSRYFDELNPDHKAALSWRDLYSTISDLTDNEEDFTPVTNFLLDQFVTFLREHTLSKSIAVSEWDNGHNSIDLRHQEPMNRATDVEDVNKPPIQIRFRSTGRKSISFSQKEWEVLLNDLDESLLNALKSGDWKPFENMWKRKGKETIDLARVGDPSGRRKTLRLDTYHDNPHLTLQSRTGADNSWYINRPVVSQREFEEFYLEDHHLPSFREDQLEALFVERDLEAAI